MNQTKLQEGQLYNFIDSDQRVSFYFLEAQKIINDLAIIQKHNSKAFSYNRDILLSLLPLNSLIKPKESIGLFIDSEEPYFRFKLELGQMGTFRTMMHPESLVELPKKLIGNFRIAKILPGSTPYSSIIKMDNMTIEEVINDVLKLSYQTQSKVLLSGFSDQAVLINILPPKDYDQKSEGSTIGLEDVLLKYEDGLQEIMKSSYQSEQDIITAYSKLGLNYLGSQKLKFFCPCSKESMISNLKKLPQDQLRIIIEEDKVIDITCDYCKKHYQIVEADGILTH